MTGGEARPIQTEDIKVKLSIDAVIGNVIALRRSGAELIGLCPFHQEKTPSFFVHPGKQLYLCRGCGAGGDVVTFYREYHGVDFKEAILALAQLAGIPVPEEAMLQAKPKQSLAPKPAARAGAATTVGQEERQRRQLQDRISLIWRESLPANGTPVETYLRGRGVDLEAIDGVPITLRFHPELAHIHKETGQRSWWPAMVAAVQSPTGKLVAVHRTYLATPDAAGRVRKAPKDRVPKSKLMLGPCVTGGTRLAPAGERLGISEGIENGLVVMSALARAGNPLPVWAALTLGNIGGGGEPGYPSRRHPIDPEKRVQTEHPDMSRPGIVLPPKVRQVVILGDGDSDPYCTRAIVNRGVRRWQAESREVEIIWANPAMDFCDMAGGGE
ncbi:CHC2 zinc finger domain-containing protein [Dongia soli]|uniref:CHC2 zinc finger domain-containing protein n=1 Tax=Dongia soli TaxID=600628 RepID=A0ABU5E8A9_9PROT|nr:CHC2 zinc finger domain-containing protein [Dongia soli]MDY0882289.1 CHC2 zinc finger domain-containing protein [Dongia soli]